MRSQSCQGHQISFATFDHSKFCIKETAKESGVRLKDVSPPFAFETMAFLLLRFTLPFPSKFKSYQMTAASFYQRINSIKFCKKYPLKRAKASQLDLPSADIELGKMSPQ